MIKCNFCKRSIPTRQMGGWKCDCTVGSRSLECEKAIKTMMEYNNTRANNNNFPIDKQ